MTKPITTASVIAYSQCLRKAYLLQCTDEDGVVHEYEQIIQRRKRDSQKEFFRVLVKQGKKTTPYRKELLGMSDDVLVTTALKAGEFEAECGFIEKVENGLHQSYCPTIFVGTHCVTKYHKLMVMFAGYVLNLLQDDVPKTGKIVRMGHMTTTVKLDKMFHVIPRLLDGLRNLCVRNPSDTSTIILSQYCIYCQFYITCKAQAEKEDNLSLLAAISTPKLMKKYKRKGIFTVNQLSCLYRPRRQRKRSRKPPSMCHSVELQALMLRVGKIYVKEPPQLSRGELELFLDIEGIPDQQFFYLLGILVCENEVSTYYGFWANTPNEEAQIWQQFLTLLAKYSNTPVYHYGSYDAKAFAKLGKRYDTDTKELLACLININPHIYGKIYPPLRSNSLKELGRFVDASWTSPDASGLQSLVWRYRWEETQNPNFKQQLLTYNQEDCHAVKCIVDFLTNIQERSDTLLDIDCFVSSKKSRNTKTNNPLHRQLETILTLAHANYDKSKIQFHKENNSVERLTSIPPKTPTREKKHRRITRKIHIPEPETCPKCGGHSLRLSNSTSEKIQVDLVFTSNGVRKSVTKYWTHKIFCYPCNKLLKSPEHAKVSGRSNLYGYGFKIWIVYQRVALRLPYRQIMLMLEDLFDEHFSSTTMLAEYLQQVAKRYSETENWIIQQLLASPFLHVDDTLLDIDHINQYVWVFTNGRHVIFRYTKSREASFVQELLGEYSGVLIADFYPGFDALTCRQQKCLVHLIRDLNNDLYANPFDSEFETFILEVKNLIVPIMEAVQRYGLKRRHLHKFQKNVDKFYAQTITNRAYKSDLCTKYLGRFIRYQESLFTFLEYDNVPWHNNPAENALRHITLQANISGVFHASVINEYLALLGIRQSCKFQKKSFLKFLISGETNLDNFSKTKEKKVSYHPHFEF